MRVLITSGGTKVPIDPVRDITNMSRGTFGAKIATELLKMGAEVDFLCAKDSRTPFSKTLDLVEEPDVKALIKEVIDFDDFCYKHRAQYKQFSYRNFNDYASELQRLIEERKPHVVVLAAAVSDYLVENPMDGKIRSGTDLTISLTPAEKLISKVRKWNQRKFFSLVGFKLLVGATDEELIAAAWKSVEENRCDLVVANDYLKLKGGNHEVILVEPTWYFDSAGDPPVVEKHNTNQALHIASKIMEAKDWLCGTSS